jgi:hypothetical protein
VTADLYVKDNAFINRQGQLSYSDESSSRAAPHSTPVTTIHARADAYDLVLDKAGAFPRDAMNTRTVEEIRTGTGGLGKIDDPLMESSASAPPDLDNDGMADAWELSKGLDPQDGADHKNDRDGDGYTNLEEYLNELAIALVSNGQSTTAGKGFAAMRRGLHAIGVAGRAGSRAITLTGPGAGIVGQIQVLTLSGRMVLCGPAAATMVLPGAAKGMALVRWVDDGRVLAQARLPDVW